MKIKLFIIIAIPLLLMAKGVFAEEIAQGIDIAPAMQADMLNNYDMMNFNLNDPYWTNRQQKRYQKNKRYYKQDNRDYQKYYDNRNNNSRLRHQQDYNNYNYGYWLE